MRTTSGPLRAALAACLFAAPAAGQLTLRVAVPEGTPAGAAVHVAGTFNRWNPADPAYRLAAEPGGRYAVTLPDSVRGPIEYKLALGSWERVETAPSGADIENRRFTVPDTGAVTLFVTVAAWRDSASRPASTAGPNVTVLDTAFAIPQLGRTRRVWIYLPPDYAASEKRYPVLYMHDGQNVFDAATSFAGEWGVDESLDSLHALGDPGAIVVAVDNGGDHRLDEYSPWRHPPYGGGDGAAYVDFLVHTLKPYIDQHYRTRPEPASTGVMGSSMGGLISLYAGLRHPGVFGRVGVFSPSLWFSDSVFVAGRGAPPESRPRIYFVSGGSEGPRSQPLVVVKDQRRMMATLCEAGWRVGDEIASATPDDGTHSEWFWRREFPAAYRWLFAGAPAENPGQR